MVAVKRDLFIEQGATFSLGMTWRKQVVVDGNIVPGDPYDLTGWKARMQIRKSQQTPVILEATSDGTDGRIVLGGATGRIEIKFTDEDTAELRVKTALYDMELESPEGDVFRFLKGSISVDPNITQPEGDPVLS